MTVFDDRKGLYVQTTYTLYVQTTYTLYVQTTYTLFVVNLERTLPVGNFFFLVLELHPLSLTHQGDSLQEQTDVNRL